MAVAGCCKHQAEADTRLLRGWGLPQAIGREWRLGHRNGSVGHVRLMQLDKAGPQNDMRADDQCRDSGGLIVKEWLTRGPDNVRLALIERIEPPLPEADQPVGFGPVFNFSQIVRDMDTALKFYCGVLGFERAVSFQTGALPSAANVLGLPPGLASQVSLDLNIVHPKGLVKGSIELVRVNGAAGLDLSDTARLPNFGMALLRHPVRGLRVFAEHLARQGWPLAMPLTRVSLAPHGEVDLLAVRTPDGAWLEFYEAAA